MRGDDRGSKTNRAEVRSDPQCGLKTNGSQRWGGGETERQEKTETKQKSKTGQEWWGSEGMKDGRRKDDGAHPGAGVLTTHR